MPSSFTLAGRGHHHHHNVPWDIGDQLQLGDDGQRHESGFGHGVANYRIMTP